MSGCTSVPGWVPGRYVACQGKTPSTGMGRTSTNLVFRQARRLLKVLCRVPRLLTATGSSILDRRIYVSTLGTWRVAFCDPFQSRTRLFARWRASNKAQSTTSFHAIFYALQTRLEPGDPDDSEWTRGPVGCPGRRPTGRSPNCVYKLHPERSKPRF